MAPDSSATPSSNQRLAQAAVTRTRPMPDSAAQSRAAGFARPAGGGEGGGGQPVVEDGLLETGLVVVKGRDEIARHDHLASGLGVESLVGVGNRTPAQPHQEGEGGQQYQWQGQPTHEPPF